MNKEQAAMQKEVSSMVLWYEIGPFPSQRSNVYEEEQSSKKFP